MNTIAKLRKLRDTLKAEGIEDVACLCSKYRQEAEEFDKLDDVLVGNVLQHQVTLTTTTLYNGVDMKDPALKYIVSELWNPLVNAQILGRKRPLDEGDTCAVYLLHYPKERLEGELKKVEKYQLEPVEAYRKWFDDRKAWKTYLHQPETVEILKKAIQSFWIHGKVNTAGGNVRPCRLVWNVFSCCKCLNRGIRQSC